MRRWHRREARAKRVRLGKPVGERLRPVKREDAPRARMRISRVPKERLHAGRFVEEWQRPDPADGEKVRQPHRIAGGLLGDGRELRSGLFRLDDTDRCAVHDQQIVARSGLEWHLSERYSSASRKINGLVVLDDPARRGQLGVDLEAGALFRGQVGHSRPKMFMVR